MKEFWVGIIIICLGLIVFICGIVFIAEALKKSSKERYLMGVWAKSEKYGNGQWIWLEKEWHPKGECSVELARERLEEWIGAYKSLDTDMKFEHPIIAWIKTKAGVKILVSRPDEKEEKSE